MSRASSRQAQRGLAALSVSLTLLFVLTLAALYLGRGVLFEIRSAGNQVRAAQARELAQAGLDWAIARLNDPALLDAACACDAGGTQTLRERLLSPGDMAFAVPSDARAACTIGAEGKLSCSCPAPGQELRLADDRLPRFVVRFTTISRRSVAVRATGCTGAHPACGQGESGAQATATVAAVLRATPAIAHLPMAAVTAGGDVTLGATLAATNDEPQGLGVSVHAGGAVAVEATDAIGTRAGGLAADSLAPHDATLQRLAGADGDTSGEALFAAFFGSTPTRFRASPTTLRIRETGGDCPRDVHACCPEPRACGRLVDATWRRTAHDHFFIEGRVAFDASNVAGGVLGRADSPAARPVLVVATQGMHIEGGVAVHGLVVVTAAGAEGVSVGDGGGSVNGALIARGALGGAGAPTSAAQRLHVAFDRAALAPLAGPRHGPMSVVPGSWHDAP